MDHFIFVQINASFHDLEIENIAIGYVFSKKFSGNIIQTGKTTALLKPFCRRAIKTGDE